MNTTQHTPGPWIVSDRWTEIHATDARATIVAEVTGAQSNPSAVADARLIAAAPELLEALEMVEQVWSEGAGHQVNPESPLGQVRAAIAKAKGNL